MTLLILGLLIFFAIHLLPSFSTTRNNLYSRYGERRFKLGFTLVAVIGLILIIIGKAYADYIPIWEPPVWTRHMAMPFVMLAFILLPAANMPTNIKRLTPHPMLWGIILWSGAHLAANGDLASMLLFGSFFLYSLFDIVSANRRGAKTQDHKVPLRKDIMVVVAGLVVYGIFLFAHPWLFGRAIM